MGCVYAKSLLRGGVAYFLNIRLTVFSIVGFKQQVSPSRHSNNQTDEFSGLPKIESGTRGES